MITFCNDQYKLLRRIGQGSFGSVFVAVHVPTRQQQQGRLTPSTSQLRGTLSPQATNFELASNQSGAGPAFLLLPGQAVSGEDQPATVIATLSPTTSAQQQLGGGGGGGGSVSSPKNLVAPRHPSSPHSPTRQQPSSLPEQQYFVVKLEQLPKDVTITSSTPPTQLSQLIYSSRSHLVREYKFYRYMHTCVGNLQGIPGVFEFGAEGQFRFMVMEHLGPSLDSLFRAKSKRFTPITTLRLAQQMISRLEISHTLGVLHRDIKPENFVMGMGDKSHVVYLIDFGLAKMYVNRDTGAHVEMQTGRKLAGTARYCSLWTHEGVSQSRRDDLEGVWYTLLYFARGSFPWDQGPADVSVEAYIHNHKKTLSPDSLCRSVEEPVRSFLLNYIAHVRSLDFAATPNYDALRGYCSEALFALGAPQNLESIFDFCWFKRQNLPSASAGSPCELSYGNISMSGRGGSLAYGHSAHSSHMGEFSSSSLQNIPGGGGGAQSSTGSQSGGVRLPRVGSGSLTPARAASGRSPAAASFGARAPGSPARFAALDS